MKRHMLRGVMIIARQLRFSLFSGWQGLSYRLKVKWLPRGSDREILERRASLFAAVRPPRGQEGAHLSGAGRFGLSLRLARGPRAVHRL